MGKGRGIIYMTGGMVSVGYVPDGQGKGCVREERMALSHTPDDCRSFADFFREHKLTSERVILCIPRSRAIVRFINLPSQEERELQKMAGYELSGLFPYPPEEFVVAYTALEKLPDGYSRLMHVAVQRQVLQWHLDFVKWAGVRPDEVWVSTQALLIAFAQSHLCRGNCGLAHFDDGFVELIFCSDRKPVFSRVISYEADCGREAALVAEALRNSGFSPERLVTAGKAPAGFGFARSFSERFGCPVEQDDSISVTRGFIPAASSVSLDLLPPELRADKLQSARKRRLFILFGVVFLNFLFALNLLFVRMGSKRDYLYQLGERIRTIDGETASLQKKLSRLNAYRSSSGSGNHKLALLAGLAEVSPGQVLLRSLDMSGGEMKGSLMLSGRAIDADTVIRYVASLKESSLVSAADVSYISKRSIDSGGWVDFEIKAAY